MRRLVTLLAPLLLATSPVAAGQRPTFVRVAQSRHVTYWAEKGETIDVARTEAFLARLGTLFPEPAAGWGIELYRHRRADDLGARFGQPVVGLTDLSAGRIDSVLEFHPHELVHAVTSRLGVPPPFFAEGLAVALTSGGRWRGADLDDAAARAVARGRAGLEPFIADFGRQDPEGAYAVAGSFVAFLLDTRGIEPMKAFLRGCGRSPSGFEQAFRAAYGRSLARLTLAWLARLSCRDLRRARAWYDSSRWPEALRRDPLPREARPASAAEALSREVTVRAEPGAEADAASR